jgi:predicted amidohydrolase
MPLSIGLITDVFFTEDAEQRLHSRLLEAKRPGADLAVLPEIPLNPWLPATPTLRDQDAEPPGGERQICSIINRPAASRALAAAARVWEAAEGQS